MDLTSGTRATATAAAVVMLGGLGLSVHGMWRDHPDCSLAGVVLSMIALTAIILTVIHHWITDTRAEHVALAAARQETQAERDRYFAAKANLEGERARLYQDLAAERAADAKRLAEERAAMEAEFEDARAEVSAEAMAILASWFVDGKVRPPERRKGNLIRFPEQGQQPAPAPQRERSRERGVVHP
jgi:hypothetical protein